MAHGPAGGLTRTFSRCGDDPYHMTEIPAGFGDVDGSDAADELVANLRYVTDLSRLRASKVRSLEALKHAPDMCMLDASSGIGFDACRFAERGGPLGCVLGVEASREMIARADLRRLFTGVLYVLTTGVSRADAPRCHGAKSTMHRLHQHLCRTGEYARLLEVMRGRGYETGRLDLSRCRVVHPDRATRLSDWPRAGPR